MKKILVIGSHPDDIEFGCGGSLYSLSRNNFKIHMYIATKGEAGGNPEIREKEQEKSARILKATIRWGSFNDTKLFFSRQLIDEIELILKKIEPDIIFVNYYDDTHQDHVAISKATITAARYIKNLIFYETPTSIKFLPNLYFDITRVLNKKLLLLRCHYSQINKTRVKNLSIIESARSTAVFRGYEARVKYAEAFMSLRFILNSICKST